jgi:SAM-dependent methyltransferase
MGGISGGSRGSRRRGSSRISASIPTRLAVLGGRYPFARFLEARAEEISMELLGPVDHVLLLRSYNHLVDPERALARALSILRPGGSLTLVDNTAFGLLRSRAAAARAEAAPGSGFEHYRNDGAADATARLAGLPLLLRERRDVGPETSNQWLLHYERLAEAES